MGEIFWVGEIFFIRIFLGEGIFWVRDFFG
jgi:hypothetical protein